MRYSDIKIMVSLSYAHVSQQLKNWAASHIRIPQVFIVLLLRCYGVALEIVQRRCVSIVDIFTVTRSFNVTCGGAWREANKSQKIIFLRYV